MAEKPILFNTEMVRAILEGRKTVTRRVVKGPYYIDDEQASRVSGLAIHKGTNITHGMPYEDQIFSPGDILWVRETWCFYWGVYWHKAGLEVDENWDCKDGCWVNDAASPGGKRWLATKAPDKWRPSIHMPREAARIFLRVTDVRVERLQEMHAEDSLREGVKLHLKGCLNGEDLLKPFADLWDSTIKPADLDRYGWYANPWVWVIGFERCDKPDGRSGTDECGWRPASTPPEQDGRYLAKYCYQHNSPPMIHFYGTLKYYATDPNPHWQHSGIGLTVEWWMPIPHTPDEEMEE